jgi:predicted nucleotidyltransferase
MVALLELDRLKAAAAAVLHDAPVRFAYLYGSVARGDAHPGSDVDVAVMFERSVPAEDPDEIPLSFHGLTLETGRRKFMTM